MGRKTTHTHAHTHEIKEREKEGEGASERNEQTRRGGQEKCPHNERSRDGPLVTAGQDSESEEGKGRKKRRLCRWRTERRGRGWERAVEGPPNEREMMKNDEKQN